MPNDSRRNDSRKFLPEVQGLRAIAVLMVVAYHVWFGRISGGVDIFLLVSAFLLTGQFARKLESGRPLELLKYWAHLFKRLLPMIVLTLLGTLLGVYLLLPETAWTSMFGQTWASLFYYQNWFLASESVDYYATDHSLASPLQHFWSLSIQGQIFIVWPLLFALAAAMSRIGRLKVRPLLIWLFGGIFIISLTFSIITTYTNQSFAYFDTRTRLWEFALGSLLALLLPYLSFKRSTRVVMGWIGVVAMLSCGLILQIDQKFPGYMALWPTLAAAFVIVAGFTGSSFGADRFLSWKPLVKLGDSSYALYLFHWPLLVFFLAFSGRDHAGPKAGTALIIVSVVAAVMITKLIDTPIRRSKWIEQKRRRAVMTIGICVLLVAAPLTVWQLQVHAKEVALENQQKAAQAEVMRNYPGATAIQPGFVDAGDPGLPMKPALTALDKQWVSLSENCQEQFLPSQKVLADKCGQTAPVAKPKKTIVIVGDSHAEQMAGALVPVAEANDWQLVSLFLGGCDFGSESVPSGRSKECQQFNTAATDYVLKLRPDAIFTISTDAVPDSPAETIIPGYELAVHTFVDAGIDVIGVRDNPRFNDSRSACVAKSGAEACEFEQSKYLASADPAASLNRMDGAYMLDLTDQYCKQETCYAVVGNVLVYLDHNHLTWDYVRTMAPVLGQRIGAATGWQVK
ncbi:acyltransferase family protein [Arthrobacter sp. H35-MC1]|uniref:acyltransferase family protein n=1 Tax=Arthrobacter sp. H35-MC1 TaxID=3046203 RepID=UPI0024BB3E9E|nr:acyltransferase family protein [Arthrobacter sp. H35-MC1]MDJ0316474.1 acyltransferase family protein [Arthrobacter sp. H35-MC1]